MGKKKDLTGKKFGRLTAIQPTEQKDCCGNTIWECRCNCGTIIYIPSARLLKGGAKSCGCLRKINLTGKRFGKLTAVRPTDKRANNRAIIWECLCDCGNTIFVSTDSLKKGFPYSCGCEMRGNDLTNLRFGKLIAIKPTNMRCAGKVIWECLCDCNTTVYVRADSLQNGITKSCGCLKSVMERKTAINLKKHNILFIAQYPFPPNRKMSFDFGIINENGILLMAIECQGEQHYHPVCFGGISKYRAKQKFASQLARDNYKRKWCAEQRIPLIEIPYNDFDLDKYLADITD